MSVASLLSHYAIRAISARLCVPQPLSVSTVC